MKRLALSIALIVALSGGALYAAVNAMMGTPITTASTVMGVTPVGEVMGQTVTAGGGGGFALVNHLEYSPNGGSLTSGTLNCTGANLIVVFVGTYKDWYSTAFTDSNTNTYTQIPAPAPYLGTAQGGTFWYCVNPSGDLSALTFTATGISGNINLYTYYGIMAFSGGATAAYDQQSGALDSTDPLQPGSITPSQPNALVVMGIFNYTAGASPTTTAADAYYGVAKSGNIGMGGSAYVVQSTATAINNTWVSSGAAGSENAVVIASFIP